MYPEVDTSQLPILKILYLFTMEDMVQKDEGTVTANMYMMKYYLSLPGLINYLLQWSMDDLNYPSQTGSMWCW